MWEEVAEVISLLPHQPKKFKLSAHSSVISHSSVCDMCLVLGARLTEILKSRAESKTALEGLLCRCAVNF